MNKEERKTVCIAIISNRGYLPQHFCTSLIELINYTKKHYHVDYFFIGSCSVNHMRNRACLIAQNRGREATGIEYDYLVQLDDDHMYAPDFIVEFIKHDKDVVLGVTCQRTPPFLPTQYKEFNGIDMKEESNLIRLKGNEGLVKVGVSGPVGMVMKTKVLDKLKYPYFQQIEVNDRPNYIGGDINFCLALQDAGIEIFCDSRYSFPHCLGENAYSDRGEVRFIY